MPTDGFSWWFEKIARLQSFYGWSEDYVLRRVAGAKLWAYYGYALENQMSIWGNSIQRKGDGPIAQEIKQIIARNKK